jgi:hypothetical protein
MRRGLNDLKLSVGISNAIFEPRVRDADCLITPIP